MEENYAKAYKEVIEILKYMPKDSVNKIPTDLLDTFKKNMDKNYEFKVDISKNLEEQNILEETRAIFANIYRDYWATPYEKDIIQRKEKFDRQKNEGNKKSKYNYDDLFKKRNNESCIVEINDNLPIIVKKGLCDKILNFIKRILK